MAYRTVGGGRASLTLLLINAHLGAQIERALGDGSQFGAQIRYFIRSLGTWKRRAVLRSP